LLCWHDTVPYGSNQRRIGTRAPLNAVEYRKVVISVRVS
jgi:hypothetical protein